jgi:hypothetical protein
VKVRSGVATPTAIELELERHLVCQDDGMRRLSKWAGYAAGKRVPSLRDGAIHSVELAEAKYPGTAAYFNSPLKTLLRDQGVDLHWVDDHLRRLSPRVTRLLFGSTTKSSSTHTYMETLRSQLGFKLATNPGLDSLEAVTLLMKRAELLAAPYLRRFAWATYVCMQSRLERLAEIAPVAADLFDAVDRSFKYWSTAHRQVIVLTSKLRTPDGGLDVNKISYLAFDESFAICELGLDQALGLETDVMRTDSRKSESAGTRPKN